MFDIHKAYADMPVEISCGSCFECRLQKAREWAMRCVHEAAIHEDNCFLTLTYDDKHLPTHGSLAPDHLSTFLKNLRQWYRYRLNQKGIKVNATNSIRFFGCGEYGDISGRPHYHLLLFNFDFLDKKRYTIRKGFQVFESQLLDSIWKKGRSEIGVVTYSSAAYCARYVMKKFTNKDPEKVKAHYGNLAPEFCRMSRRPGLGQQWFDKFKKGVYTHDSIIVNGKELKPPRYYDSLFEAVSPDLLKAVKCRRKDRVDYDEQRSSRLYSRKLIGEKRQSLFGGGEL